MSATVNAAADPVKPTPSRSIVGGIAASLYTTGAGVRSWFYGSRWIPQKRLGARVVSVGNISFGGTGKTPFTIWLAKRLAVAGTRASILTRGYGRTSTEPVRFFFPGALANDAVRDGDEVQLYLRQHVNVPIGIADHRYDAGRVIEDRFRVDVHLLDDGFQHLTLARDLDIVLIDASNPWGARAGLSRALRESPRALRRAHAVVLTRCETAASESGREQLAALRKTLRTFNPRIPQFLCATRLVHLIDSRTGKACSLDQAANLRIAAFCGLGNPEQFLTLLAANGIRPAATRTFPDHHKYTAEEASSLDSWARENRACVLLTSEKDIVNFPEPRESGVPVYWASIDLQLEDEDRLLVWIGERLGSSDRQPSEQAAAVDH